MNPDPFTVGELIALGEGRQSDEWDRHSVLLATIENIVGPEPRVTAKDRNPFEAIDKPKAVSEAERKINREFAAIHMKRTLNGKGKWKR